MYCNKCNQNNHEGAAFCAFCGSPLATPQPAAEQPITAPVYTPEMTTPNYTAPEQTPLEPTAFQPVAEPQSDGYYEAQPVAQKKKFKKALLIIPAALIALVLIGALVMNLLISNAPQYQVINAFTSSTEQLESKLKHANTCYEIYENISDIIENREGSIEMRAEVDDTADIQFRYDYSLPKKYIRLDSNLEVNGTDFDLAIAANEQKLMLQFEEINDNIYALPLKNFGKEFENSELAAFLEEKLETSVMDAVSEFSINLFADADFDAFREAYKDFDEWVVKLDIEEVDYNILNTKDLTVYRAKINEAEFMRIYNKYSLFQQEQLLGKEAVAELGLAEKYDDLDAEEDTTLVIYFGINDDDCLAAVYGYVEGEEDDSYGLVMAGQKNIWDEILIYESDEEVGGITFTEFEDGFNIDFFDTERLGQRETMISIVCDDREGELRFSADGEEFVLEYDRVDGRDVLTFDISNEVDFTLSFAPFNGVRELKGEEKALLDFGEDDLQDLLKEFVDYFK